MSGTQRLVLGLFALAASALFEDSSSTGRENITYDERLATLSQYADYGVTLRTCGKLRVVGVGGGRSGFTEYFDERGELVDSHAGGRPSSSRCD